MTKPTILLDFSGSVVTWASAWWGDDAELMAAARTAIQSGNSPEEVIELLSPTFDVIDVTVLSTGGKK